MASFELTDQQKSWIKINAADMKYSVSKLTRAMTGDETKDGRSLEGQAIKQFIMDHLNQKPKMNLPQTAPSYELNEEQKLFVKNNMMYCDSTLDMLLMMFPGIESQYNKGTLRACKEIKAIQRYVKELDPSLMKFAKEDKETMERFRYPRNLEEAIPIINKYTGLEIKRKEVREEYVVSIENLCRNLKNIRLIKTVEAYSSDDEKEIFLNSFIRDTWDKPDLTTGEIEQYVDLADERVGLFKIKKHQDRLQEAFDEAIDSEDGKIGYTLVESIDKQIQNLDKCRARIDKIQKSLEGTRDARLKNAPKRDVTILRLVEIFKKEEDRERYLKMAEVEREALKNEANRLEDMSEYNARILGISREEILN